MAGPRTVWQSSPAAPGPTPVWRPWAQPCVGLNALPFTLTAQGPLASGRAHAGPHSANRVGAFCWGCPAPGRQAGQRDSASVTGFGAGPCHRRLAGGEGVVPRGGGGACDDASVCALFVCVIVKFKKHRVEFDSGQFGEVGAGLT